MPPQNNKAVPFKTLHRKKWKPEALLFYGSIYSLPLLGKGVGSPWYLQKSRPHIGVNPHILARKWSCLTDVPSSMWGDVEGSPSPCGCRSQAIDFSAAELNFRWSATLRVLWRTASSLPCVCASLWRIFGACVLCGSRVPYQIENSIRSNSISDYQGVFLLSAHPLAKKGTFHEHHPCSVSTCKMNEW